MAAGREPGTCAVGYAADDDIAAITANVITQTGFVPIRVGTLAQSGPSIPAECYSTAC
jgi:8-hydroxy-5-deazaflavin:NADPH oxidoreductase